MSELVGRWIPGLDPVTGTLALPLWSAGALAALVVVFCALAFSRAGRDGVVGALARVTLVLVGAAATWLVLDGTARQDLAAERRALEARAGVLTTRATTPGLALACLDAMAGDAVEGSCERTLFATPEAMAAGVSYVAAQLALFADVSEFARRSNVDMETMLAVLRRAIETDRFGLVAHVLATRDGCTVAECPAVALLQDARRVNANLAKRTYQFYVARHSTVWPQPAPGPTANAMPPMPATQPTAPPVPAAVPPPSTTALAPRPPGPGVFIPSADSIPAVNIMTAEPGGEPQTTGRTQPPQRRPAAQSKQAPPMDLNAGAKGAPAAR